MSFFITLLKPGLAAALFCLASHALASEPITPAKTTPDDTVPTIFGNSEIKPWGMHIEGSDQGLLIDVQYALSIETGFTHRVLLLPYSRAIHSVKTGMVDMAGLIDAKADLSYLIKVAPIIETQAIIVAKAGSPPITSLSELDSKRIGHIRGSKYGPKFDNATHFTKVPLSSMFQGLEMLLNGRIDAMTALDLTFYWAIKQMQIEPSRLTQLLIVSRPSVSLYMSKKSPHQSRIPAYRKAMKQLHKKGIIEDIFGQNSDWNKMDGWSAPWVPAPTQLIDKTSNDVQHSIK